METNEFIKHFFHLGLSHKEICLHLENHQLYISIRTLKRKLKKLNLCRRINCSPYNDVYQFKKVLKLKFIIHPNFMDTNGCIENVLMSD